MGTIEPLSGKDPQAAGGAASREGLRREEQVHARRRPKGVLGPGPIQYNHLTKGMVSTGNTLYSPLTTLFR